MLLSDPSLDPKGVERLVRTVAEQRILRNVMLNLLSNAVKYSSDDIEVASETAQGKTVIKVKDKGIGIPYEDQGKMFGKFFRAQNTGLVQGSGLGLNIVAKYIGVLGGSITFTIE